MNAINEIGTIDVPTLCCNSIGEFIYGAAAATTLNQPNSLIQGRRQAHEVHTGIGV